MGAGNIFSYSFPTCRVTKERPLRVDEGYDSDNQVVAYPTRDARGPQLASGRIALGFILDFARRRSWVILFSVLVMCGVGLAYLMLVPALYTGVAILQIDPRTFQLFSQAVNLGDQSFGGAQVESHLEALKSENLELKVINDLHLSDDAEFGLAAAIPIISNLVETRSPDSETWRTRNALRIFDKRYTVQRRGIFLIEINFESANPERAAQIANAIAQAYVTEQLAAKYEITREGSKWLEGRIGDLRDQVSAADKAIIDYKEEHQIVDAGGRPLTEQQLTDLSNQLAVARAKVSGMRARLDRINAAVDDPNGMSVVDVTAGEGISRDLLVKLRSQYQDLAAREAEWSQKYGHDHLAVVNLRNNMRSTRASILDELERLRDAYKSDYEVASEAEKHIETQLQRAITESQMSNEAQLRLRSLETSAATYKSLYDNFVSRQMEANEQQSFPYTEARVITNATPPLRPTYRKSLLVVAMTPLMGLVLGIGLGALRDLMDRGFRTGVQIESMLGLGCIALVPLQRKPENKAASPRTPSITSPSTGLIPSEVGIASTVVEAPFSRFSEAIRTIKLAADLNGVVAANKVIGITSAIPNEGKSTIATALALSIAQVGGRAILVDCDLRNPTLSRALAPSANAGILEVLSGKVALDEALDRKVFLSMAFLPVFSKVRIADSSEILSSSAVKRMFERLRHSYDQVIVDLPPLTPLADVRATTHLVDSYLLVVQWGGPSTAIVQHALNRAPGVYEKAIGAILNKVDMKALRLYDGDRASYYHSKAYGRYGYTD